MSLPMQLVKRPYRAVTDRDTIDLLAVMTAVTLLAHGGRRFWWVHVLIVVFVFSGVVFRGLFRSAAFWLLFAAALIYSDFHYYHRNDNHEYLFGYWCLALGCGFLLPDPEKAMAVNARWLIALVFVVATIWKVTTAHYIDGSTLLLEMIQNENFFEFSRLLAGYTEEMADANRQALETARSYATHELVPIEQPPEMLTVARYLSWITIAVEAIVAVFFLIPSTKTALHLRNISLVFFLIVLYPMVNIIGFSLILAILGVAQCGADLRPYRFAYCVVFIVLACFEYGHLKRLIMSHFI